MGSYNKYQKSIDEIKKLSVSEKLSIVEDIWDSITLSGEDYPVTEEQKKELDRRLEEHKNNPGKAKEWSKVKTEILSQL